MKQTNCLLITWIILTCFCFASFSGCLESNEKTEPNSIFSLNTIKTQYKLNASFQKLLSNGSTNTYNEKSWTQKLLSYSQETVNESSKFKWEDQKYVANWNYYILANLTKKQGNMTIIFNENYTLITKFFANDSFIDNKGKIWNFQISAINIPLTEHMSSENYKRFMLNGNETCMKIITLDFSQEIPSYHQKLTPGTTSLIDFNCNEFSTISISLVQS